MVTWDVRVATAGRRARKLPAWPSTGSGGVERSLPLDADGQSPAQVRTPTLVRGLRVLPSLRPPRPMLGTRETPSLRAPLGGSRAIPLRG